MGSLCISKAQMLFTLPVINKNYTAIHSSNLIVVKKNVRRIDLKEKSLLTLSSLSTKTFKKILAPLLLGQLTINYIRIVFFMGQHGNAVMVPDGNQ